MSTSLTSRSADTYLCRLRQLEVRPNVVAGVVASVYNRDLGERPAPSGARVHRIRQPLVARLVDVRGHEVEARDEARVVRLDAQVVARAASTAEGAADEDRRRVDGVRGAGVQALRTNGDVPVRGDAAELQGGDGDSVGCAHRVDGGREGSLTNDGVCLDGTDEGEGEEGESHAEDKPKGGRRFVTLKLVDFGARDTAAGDAQLNLLLFEADSVVRQPRVGGGKDEIIYKGRRSCQARGSAVVCFGCRSTGRHV